MTNPELEEKLREAACFGDIDGVKELLAKGVNVNSQHDINGWTALHWAAKRNHLNIVNLLCNHGADKSITTNKSESAASLTTEGVIKVLLNAQARKDYTKEGTNVPRTPDRILEKDTRTVPSQKPLAIVPNYIRDPPLAYQVDIPDRNTSVDKKPRLDSSLADPVGDNRYQRRVPRKEEIMSRHQELIVKVRVAEAEDTDFIEVDLPRSALTLEYLIVISCEELGIAASTVDRVRKLPNTRLRRDKEVTRLTDYQELELILKPANQVDPPAEAATEAVTEITANGDDADNIEEPMTQ